MSCRSVEERLCALESAVKDLYAGDDSDVDSDLDHSDNPPPSPQIESLKCDIPQLSTSIPQEALPNSFPIISEQIPSSIPISLEPVISQWDGINGQPSTTTTPSLEAKLPSRPRALHQTHLPPWLGSDASTPQAQSIRQHQASLKAQMSRTASSRMPSMGTFRAQLRPRFPQRNGLT